MITPDQFGDLKMEQKVKDFYKDYLNYKLTDDDVKLILAAKPPVEA